jgi:modification methylase
MRIIKPTGTMCYNHKDMIFNFTVISPLSWIFKTNAVFRQRVTWDRCGMQAFNNVRFYRTEEDIYILGKEAKGFKWNKEAAKYKSIWRISPSKKNDGHPCSFPEEIPRRCIEAFTEENDIVLDPFCGVGTTCLVANQMNRRYLGFDISDKYCNIAKERLGNVEN